MSSKVKDKIATIVLYIVSALVILLLVSLIGYILYNGRQSLNLNFYLVNQKLVKLVEELDVNYLIHFICL